MVGEPEPVNNISKSNTYHSGISLFPALCVPVDGFHIFLLHPLAIIPYGKNTFSKLTAIVEDNYAICEFGLAFAAEKMNMNSSYLSRLFKKEAGMNFLDYLLNVRIEKAKFLLSTTSLHNLEIAQQVGFESEHYFGQVFKKCCGMTPKQYQSWIKKQ